MSEEKKENKKDIQKDTLQPVTKVNTKLDKELQELEVESTKGGGPSYIFSQENKRRGVRVYV
ncbi:MAG TPA: hypothetical protein VE264_00055 [Nitrososphaera sp.]|jgi:hypothetical protein|nr:hypothetical protein [Nitrososphaera sp.]